MLAHRQPISVERLDGAKLTKDPSDSALLRTDLKVIEKRRTLQFSWKIEFQPDLFEETTDSSLRWVSLEYLQYFTKCFEAL